MINKLIIVKDLFSFLWERKLWWLIPMLLVFMLFTVAILFLGSSPLAPIIYPLF